MFQTDISQNFLQAGSSLKMNKHIDSTRTGWGMYCRENDPADMQVRIAENRNVIIGGEHFNTALPSQVQVAGYIDNTTAEHLVNIQTLYTAQYGAIVNDTILLYAFNNGGLLDYALKSVANLEFTAGDPQSYDIDYSIAEITLTAGMTLITDNLIKCVRNSNGEGASNNLGDMHFRHLASDFWYASATNSIESYYPISFDYILPIGKNIMTRVLLSRLNNGLSPHYIHPVYNQKLETVANYTDFILAVNNHIHFFDKTFWQQGFNERLYSIDQDMTNLKYLSFNNFGQNFNITKDSTNNQNNIVYNYSINDTKRQLYVLDKNLTLLKSTRLLNIAGTSSLIFHNNEYYLISTFTTTGPNFYSGVKIVKMDINLNILETKEAIGTVTNSGLTSNSANQVTVAIVNNKFYISVLLNNILLSSILVDYNNNIAKFINIGFGETSTRGLINFKNNLWIFYRNRFGGSNTKVAVLDYDFNLVGCMDITSDNLNSPGMAGGTMFQHHSYTDGEYFYGFSSTAIPLGVVRTIQDQAQVFRVKNFITGNINSIPTAWNVQNTTPVFTTTNLTLSIVANPTQESADALGSITNLANPTIEINSTTIYGTSSTGVITSTPYIINN